jgi:glycosyltransferase involved in cell wall biosynthesis
VVKRRVVHYVDSDNFGGSEEAALHLMASLDRGRWEPVLLHHPEAGIARLVEGAARLGIRTLAVPRGVSGGRPAGVIRLWRALRAERPAVFHAHLSWPFACKHGVLAARLAGLRAIVGTAQLYLAPEGARQPPGLLRLYRRIIAVSEEVKSRYARELGVPAHKLTVVRNAIRVTPAGRQGDPALRAMLVRGRPNYVVLTPARLHPQKGHAYLLAAAAHLPAATFVLAGDGPLRPALEAQAQALGVADRCVFLGHRADVADLLAVSDVLVLPSLYEGLPVSVLEAMAAERPVVATAIGGTDEAITSERTGLLVPPRDPAALAAAIHRLQADPDLARRLASAGRERVEREFSSDVMALQVMGIYDEVLAETGAMPVDLETPEQARNARLRRVDWRFLLPSPRPRRALCREAGPLADAITDIAGETIVGGPASECDLAVAENPDATTLTGLHEALRPGGACYTEWRPHIGGARRVQRALRAAGFADVVCYRPGHAPAAQPAFWIPVDAPGAAAYVRARGRLRGGRLRRLLASVRQRVRDALRGRFGSAICSIAYRPPKPGSTEFAPSSWLRDGWPDWGLGAPPDRLSTLLVTGGPRSVSKVVVLAFAEPSATPLVAVKAPRVEEAAAGVRREGAALEHLAARRPGGVPGVPRMLVQREIAGVPLLGETALVGRPLDSLMTSRSVGPWSTKIADWLAALVSPEPALSPAHWRDAIVEPTLARFEELFGGVVDPGLLQEGKAIVRAIGALPAVAEQRDLGPWNVLVTPGNEIAVLDWESAEVDGLPALDLLYYLAYASFAADRAGDRASRIASYRRSLDSSKPMGAIRRDCLARYLDALGLDSSHLAPLRGLVWLIHTESDVRHATADAGGPPPPQALARSLFLALWIEEVRHIAAR